MKSFKLFTIFLIALTITLLVHLSVSNPLMCEPKTHPLGTYDRENLFFSIHESAPGAWNVIFENVRMTYRVTASSREHLGDLEHYDFRMKQLTASPHTPFDKERVDQTRVSKTIVGAVMDHFNDIQRGNVHTHSPNYINPNAHAKLTQIPGYKSDIDINSPLDQFVIKEFVTLIINLGTNVKFLFTNMAFYLCSSSYIALILHLLYNKARGLLSNFWSLNKESIYGTIHGIVINQINVIKGQKFLPFIYTLFTFIFINNLVGMVPYNFSPTSHFILTFFLSFTVVIGASILGLISKKMTFFSIFVPEGCPFALLPLLVLIEFISYLARNVSLGLRLAANVLSGHMLLNILSGFTYNIVVAGIIGFAIGLIPLTFISAFSTLEIGICFIQSQVFSVLSSSYIKDGV